MHYLNYCRLVSIMPKKSLILIVSWLILSCQSGPRFKQMTEKELATYNMEKPVSERVYCYEKESISSRIPRYVCETLGELYNESGNNAMSIENLIPNGSVFTIN